MKILFPTKENMSYISRSASSLEEAVYFTVLDVNENDIIGVESVRNKKFANNEDFIKACQDCHYDAIIVPQAETLPVEELKSAGISVYNNKDSQTVLNAFSDYMNQKLQMA